MPWIEQPGGLQASLVAQSVKNLPAMPEICPWGYKESGTTEPLILPGVGPWRQVRRVTEKPLWACFRLWASWRRAWGWWGLSPTAALDLTEDT